MVAPTGKRFDLRETGPGCDPAYLSKTAGQYVAVHIPVSGGPRTTSFVCDSVYVDPVTQHEGIPEISEETDMGSRRTIRVKAPAPVRVGPLVGIVLGSRKGVSLPRPIEYLDKAHMYSGYRELEREIERVLRKPR